MKRGCLIHAAFAFASALCQSPHYWLNFQATCYLRTVQAGMQDSLAAVQALVSV